MNEQDKQLLLKDLCARLPHHVKVRDDMGRVYELTIGNAYLIDLYFGDGDYVEPPIKAYLRQMSSMTEEERKEYRKTQYKEVVVQYPSTAAPNDVEIWCSTASTYDYLNSIHVDYRGLIPMGLALPAPEGMYNTK